MKVKISFLAAIALAICFITSCRTNHEVSGAVSAMTVETVSLGDRGDGSIVLRAWGSGANMGDAIEQAKRNALHDVLFTGIKRGSRNDRVKRPLIPDVNAEEKYSIYFDPFFSLGGEYKNFVVEEPGSAKRMKSTGLSRDGYGVVVIVDYAKLKQQLLNDGILTNY